MNFKRMIAGLLAFLCTSVSMLAEIQPGRGIQLSISGVPSEDKSRFDGIYPVSESGTINMPFIGAVKAAGLRAEQLAASLESRYKSEGYYTHPTIQVIDSTTQRIDEQIVVVGGQVRRTGPVPWSSKLTLYQAIQAAGGATEFGSMKRVKLLRAGKQKQYDLTQLQFMQIPLEPNDTIEVPQKNPWGG
jgi:protein involved in polysaccharide export with SLBB domain